MWRKNKNWEGERIKKITRWGGECVLFSDEKKEYIIKILKNELINIKLNKIHIKKIKINKILNIIKIKRIYNLGLPEIDKGFFF